MSEWKSWDWNPGGLAPTEDHHSLLKSWTTCFVPWPSVDVRLRAASEKGSACSVHVQEHVAVVHVSLLQAEG